jgi:hypothetical protein
MNKISQWAGYLASFFSIAFCVMVSVFMESDVKPPTWIPVITGWCMMLGAFSGVVCLVSAAFNSFRNRKKTPN